MQFFPSKGRTRLLAGLALAASVTMTLSACGGDSGTPAGSGSAASDEKVAVTLITKNANNPFFVAMQEGAKAEAEKQNADLTVAFGAADGDEAGQIAAIEESIARGDKGILITPNGPGVNDALGKARAAGMFLIALDTPPEPADTVDITFATDNFKAGEAIGKWAAVQMDGKTANIAMLDLFNDKIVSVDYNRDQGFLTGMGIDTKDPKKNGDEAETGKYTGGKGGDYKIVCHEPTQGAQDAGKTGMENCLAGTKDINLVYSINEPAGLGASEALQAAGVTGATIVSVDGGCDPGITSVKSGVIGATSQQYPLKMAQLGVEAIVKIAKGGEKPAVTPGLDFFDTGVALVTDKPADGVESIDTTAASKICWG